MFQSALKTYLDRYPRLAYIHVPKCAGVSAAGSVYQTVFPRALKVTRAYRRISLRSSLAAQEILGVDMMKSREVTLIDGLSDPAARFISGHVHANPATVRNFGDWKFLTLLREPRERFLSHYVYNRFKSSEWWPLKDEFSDYVGTERARRSGAAFALYFSGMGLAEIESDPDAAVEASIDNLGRFASVGFLDDLDGWLASLESLLGRRPKMPHLNKTPNPQLRTLALSSELSTIVDGLCATDRKIYDRLRARLDP